MKVDRFISGFLGFSWFFFVFFDLRFFLSHFEVVVDQMGFIPLAIYLPRASWTVLMIFATTEGSDSWEPC